MALSPQEQQIVLYGKKNGKSLSDINSAIADFRQSSATPVSPAKTPSIGDRLSNVGTNSASRIATDLSGTSGMSPIRAGVDSVAAAASLPIAGANALLPNAVQDVEKKGGEVVSGLFHKLTDLLSPQVAVDFVTKHPQAAKALEETLGATAGLGEIAGNIAGAEGAVSTANKIANAGTKVLDSAASATSKASSIPTTSSGIKNAVTDALTPIDKATASVLNPTKLIPDSKIAGVSPSSIASQAVEKSKKLEDYIRLSEKAAVDYSKPTALVKAGDKGTEALKTIGERLTKQGKLKTASLGAVGEKTISNIGTFRAGLRDALRERVGVNIINDEGKLSIENAAGRASKVAFDTADNKLMLDSYRALARLGKTPTVRQLDDTVDALQDLLYKRKSLTAVPVNGQVEGVLKNITGKLNGAVKKVAGEQYTKANAKYAYYKDTFDALNKALGDEGVRGGTLMKSLFSPSGEAPRRLFAQVKKLTGVDLVEEATLAKFAMESVGDARQASMLEELLHGGVPTPTSLVGKAVNKLLDSSKDPIGKARRMVRDRSVK